MNILSSTYLGAVPAFFLLRCVGSTGDLKSLLLTFSRCPLVPYQIQGFLLVSRFAGYWAGFEPSSVIGFTVWCRCYPGGGGEAIIGPTRFVLDQMSNFVLVSQASVVWASILFICFTSGFSLGISGLGTFFGGVDSGVADLFVFLVLLGCSMLLRIIPNSIKT